MLKGFNLCNSCTINIVTTPTQTQHKTKPQPNLIVVELTYGIDLEWYSLNRTVFKMEHFSEILLVSSDNCNIKKIILLPQWGASNIIHMIAQKKFLYLFRDLQD